MTFRYSALVRGEEVHEGDDLADVLEVLLDELIDDDNAAEDVAIWEGHRLAAVILGRAITVFPTPADVARLAS
jgi:hypothetical protein